MANTKVTQHVIANNAITADQLASAAVTDAKLHATLDLSGKTLTLPATAIPSASTATTQAASDNSTKLATTAYVTTALANLVDSSPSSLNTLNELAAALNDDASFSTTVTNSIATKLPLAGGTLTGALTLSGAPTNALHPATKTYTDTADALKLNLSGGTLTGDLILNTTTALQIPAGTTGQRPSAATAQIRWNTTDGALEVYNGSAWTAVGTGSSNKVLNTFTGDGSTTTFALTVTPANEDALMVFIDGAYQEAGDYVLTNNQLALDVAPLSGEKVSAHITTASVHDGTSAVNQQFTGDGSTTAFTLSQDPKSENNTHIYINGVYQQKTDYTVTGTTLTFDTAPTNGDIIEVNMFTVATLGNTDTVTEGVGNLYHTTARARGAISVSGNAISYNSSTGVLTANFEEGPVFTGHVSLSDSKYVRLGNDADFIIYHDGATNYVQAVKQDSDIIFRGNDGGTNFNALTLDMSDAGKAIFNSKVTIGASSHDDTLVVFTDASNKGITIHSGSTSSFENPTLTFIDQGNSTSTLAVKGDAFCFSTYNTTNALQVIGNGGLTKANNGLEVSGAATFNSNVGIGIPSPDSALHVQSGSAGSVTAYSDTTFTTEASSTNQFWSILGPANQNQGILFGDADSNWRGQVRYAHDGDYMQLYAGQQDSPPALSIVSADEGRSLGVKNSNPKAHLHVGGHGVTVNTTLDISRTAIFRTDGTGNYSSSGNKSAAHAATFMRSSDAATGDQVGHSYVFDNGNWSATAEIMAEVENDANAYSRLNFKTWNGSMLTRQVITSDGQVIKPYQSGFYAVKSSAQTISVGQAVIFNTATENVGADYNTSNGVYTAPYSGFYLFSYTILLGPNLTNDIDVDHYLKTSNRNYIGGHPGRTRYLSTGTSGWGDGYMGFGHTQIAYMDANDTAYVDFSQLYYNGSNGTAPVYANTSNNWTKFSGYFLG